MVGVAEMYFAKFILTLKLGQIASGLIMTVPLMLGAALSLMGPRLLRRVGSFSRYNGIVAAQQGLMLFPLAACAVAAPFVLPILAERGLTWVATAVIFVIVTLYFFGAMATAAPWMTITGELVPASIRANFNARRLRLLQGATLCALLFHGLAADGIDALFRASPRLQATGLDSTLCGFALAFTIGGVLRLLSSWHLFHYSTPKSTPMDQSKVHAIDFVARFRRGNDGRFLLYALAANFALQISQPFTNPFMLEQIKFTGSFYTWLQRSVGENAPYSLLLAAVYLGRVIALPLAGKFAQRHSAHSLLWVGAVALIPMAIFWLASARFEVILLGQIATGAALGVWELAVFLMNFDTIKAKERTAMITYYTLANETSKTAGSFVGGGLLSWLGKDYGAYVAVFGLSAAVRLAALALLAGVKKP